MIGPVISLLVLMIIVSVIGGIGIWVKQSRSQPRPSGVAGTTGAAGVAPAAGEARPSRVSMLTEAVGYVGMILVLAGASAAVGQRWADIGTAGRLVILGAATLIFLGIGWFIRSSTEPAYQRLTSVAWAVSVGAFAGSVAVVNQFYDTSDKTTFLTIATTSTVYAAILWFLHQRAIQQAAVFAGVLLSTASVIVSTVSEPDAWMFVLPLWAIGVAWAAAGWWRRIAPWFVAVPLGLLVALIAPSAIDEPSGVRFALGIGTAATVMVLSVGAKFTPGLAMASLAMLGYVIGAVTYYFGDTLGVPASLTIAGLLILGLTAVATRWHWFSRKQPQSVEPSSSTSDSPSVAADHHHVA